jgi:hypothetical protein
MDDALKDASGQVSESEKPSEKIEFDVLLSQVLMRFISSIEGLATSFPVTTSAIEDVGRKASSELRRFLDDHASVVSHPDSESRRATRFQIDPGLEDQAGGIIRKMQRAANARSLVPRSLFVSLVSAYDHFLRELIRALLLIRPEILSASEKTMRFSDLVKFDSIEAARHFIIEKEVDTVLRESHKEHFDWMQSKFDLPLTKGLHVWPEFIEITERRNLFVHTGGVVSEQYLKTCSESKADANGASKGDQLSVSPEYFERAFEVLFEIGVKLAQVLWRKLLPDTLQQADQNLLDISYRLISEERYKLAIVLLDFAVEVLPRHSSADVRLRFVFNRAQAYKWSGDDSRARAQIKAEDLSAASPVFKLAAACIHDDLNQSIGYIREIGSKGEIGLPEIRGWPIFKQMRAKDEFADVISETFGEPLVKGDVAAALPLIAGGESKGWEGLAKDGEQISSSDETL